MGMEDRDWYRDWHKSRNGYTERSDFRTPENIRQKRTTRSAWSSFFIRVFVGLAAIYGALAILKNHVLPLL